jgi:DNA invertase Pin-like site-specific DNA recombinase
MNPMNVAIYARVSTMDQSPLMQLDALRAYCKAKKWEIYREYVDQGVSGATSSRPFLDAMMRDANCAKFNAVLVWKFDRLFRSVEHMLKALEMFRTLEIEFISLTEAIDTTTSHGRFLYTMLAAVAEFSKDLLRERTKAGMDRARRAGHRIGRPPAEVDIKQLLALRYPKDGEAPLSMAAISQKTGIAQTTVFKRLTQAVSKGSPEFGNANRQPALAKNQG